LFVGSGVLFESTSRLSNLIGTGASLLPLTLLSIGYAFNSDAQASFNGDSMLMLFVLALAGSGAPAIAVACRANGTRVLGGQSVVPEAAGAQMVALLERARLSEERAARAEHQLAAGGSLQPNAPRLALDDEELALTQPRGGSGWFGWAAAAVVLAIMVAWYAFGYAPLRGELANAEQASAKQAEEHAAALASLRRDFERKRTDLEQQLAAAAQPAAAQPAIAAPSPKASPRAVAVPQDVASDAARDDVSDASAEREARAQARRDARVAKREQAAAARAERTAEHDANLAAAKEEREAARQARAAEHEQKVAERHARVTERAEARASEREAKATERAEPKTTERADPKTGEKVERSAAAAATAALEAQAYGADTSKSSKRAAEKPAPVPAAPKKSAADVDDESSNDPLEGL